MVYCLSSKFRPYHVLACDGRVSSDRVVRGVLSATPRISIQLGTLKNAVHVKTGMIFLPGLQASR